MESEETGKRFVGRSHISPGALAEICNALGDYEKEVREAADARDGIAEATVKTYTDGPRKFAAWLIYAYPLHVVSTAGDA